ncbi:MAG: superoxide dismutase [Patescibacteria group bacterium]
MFVLPPLPYSYNALEPYIDEQTLIIHHDKHHQGYVNKLNKALEQYKDLLEMPLEELITNLDKVPEGIRTAVTNSAGQVYNHNLYWESMSSPNSSTLSGELADKIDTDFGSFENFKERFSTAGTGQFGSGWVWLSLDQENKLVIDKTGNADSPLMHGKKPLMTMDVWEHAYYLNYQNRRPDYIEAFYNVINWEEVARKYEAANGQL